ncbi:MAG: ABC transporter permease, partial [Prevotellaceae bacterium]|nr:ABC transporter permease [Prevotellaceae bacterium]
AKALLEQTLSEYGVRVTTTNERLKQFNSVTDTYLSIFMMLGGLGLLLGIMSFVIVIRKNLFMRHKEIALYRTLGFPERRIERILYKENIWLPLYAIVTGVFSALVSASMGFANIGGWLWLTAVLFTLLFVECTRYFVQKTIRTVMKTSGL